MSIRSLAVFCGSKPGNNPTFLKHTVELAAIMIQQEVTLVYGGASVGIMGTIADEIMKAGGKAIGVIPQILVNWERQHTSLTELLVVEDMHVRKKKMYELSDAAVILPGGMGTLDELFEMITWNQLSIHDKNIFLINSAGFYDHLINHIAKMNEEGFLYEDAKKRLIILNEPSELVQYLNA